MKNGERTFMFAGEVDNFRVADHTDIRPRVLAVHRAPQSQDQGAVPAIGGHINPWLRAPKSRSIAGV